MYYYSMKKICLLFLFVLFCTTSALSRDTFEKIRFENEKLRIVENGVMDLDPQIRYEQSMFRFYNKTGNILRVHYTITVCFPRVGKYTITKENTMIIPPGNSASDGALVWPEALPYCEQSIGVIKKFELIDYSIKKVDLEKPW